MILVVYFVDSCRCSWKAVNHLMRTNFLTFWFYFKDLTEKLNALRCVRSGCLTIGTRLIWKNSESILVLLTWCPTCALLISDILCCCLTCCFLYCANCCAYTKVDYKHKALKVYLCNLIEALFINKLDWWHFCIKLLHLCQNVRFVTTNLSFLTS